MKNLDLARYDYETCRYVPVVLSRRYWRLWVGLTLIALAATLAVIAWGW